MVLIRGVLGSSLDLGGLGLIGMSGDLGSVLLLCGCRVTAC